MELLQLVEDQDVQEANQVVNNQAVPVAQAVQVVQAAQVVQVAQAEIENFYNQDNNQCTRSVFIAWKYN